MIADNPLEPKREAPVQARPAPAAAPAPASPDLSKERPHEHVPEGPLTQMPFEELAQRRGDGSIPHFVRDAIVFIKQHGSL